MGEFQTFECPGCGDTFFFQGKEFVLHKGSGPLPPDFMKFRVVVDECNCPCGATFQNRTWKKKVVDVMPSEVSVGSYRYLTYEGGEWIETREDAVKAFNEIKNKEATLRAKLARESKKKGAKR